MNARVSKFWKENLRPLLVMGIVMFSFRSAFADWNDVPTGSMKPTIVEGDRVVVNKLAYDLKIPFTLTRLAQWDDPKRGEIIVFFSPYDGTRLVKRVIGVPGDQVEMRDEQLFINGQAAQLGEATTNGGVTVREENLAGVTHRIRLLDQKNGALTNFAPVVVPPGQYLALGDNRDESFDSRYWGFVPRRSIVGRASAVAFSLNREHYYLPRLDRFFESL